MEAQGNEDLMEGSLWVEVVTHPVTGERTMFQAETVDELERQIEAWKRSLDSATADQGVREGASAS